MAQAAATKPSIDDLFESALRLSAELRARLAQVLLSSLQEEPETRSSEAWLIEVERRARDAHDGAPGIPWSEARRQIEDSLRSR
jgi:putative addiction module component (TIGR02574 family)